MPEWKVRPFGSNWGDFGADDRLGRLNLITPERRKAALAEVQAGLTFTLSLPLDYPGGHALSHHRRPPELFAGATEDGISTYARAMSQFAPQFTDVVNDEGVTLYPQYSTQWDALGHVGHRFDADGDGQAEVVYYNGFRPDGCPCGIDGASGQPLGVEHLATAGLQGRGVLVNILAAMGRTRARIGFADLQAMLETQGVEVRAGDILCLYTGYADALLDYGKQPDAGALRRAFGGLDGADPQLLDWITESGVAAICADNPAVEYVSNQVRGDQPHALLPLHEHCLFKLGLPLGELWYLKDLAEWLAQHRRHAFLLTAPPLRLTGAAGSPVTPLALV